MQTRRLLALGILFPALACSSDKEEVPLGGAGGALASVSGAGNGVAGTLPLGGGAAGSPGAAGSTGGARSGAGGSAGSIVAGAATSGGAQPVTSGGAGASAGVPGSTGGAGGSAGAVNGGAAGGAEPSAPVYDYGAKVENTSADCEVAALPEGSTLTTKIAKLPDPFTKIDGTRITKKSDWHCRRQEILEQAKKYVFGDKPTPDKVTGTVENNKVNVHVEAMGKSIDFSANIKLPSSGQAPYPAIINVGSSGLTLGEARILQEGVAIIYYNHYDLGKEGTPEQSRGKPNPGKFYDIYGGTHSAGLLMAWAWGASRLIDVLQSSGQTVIDVGKLGVTGCSRNGKGAFTIGVFDERIALTIPHETSTAGVPAYRIVDVLNTERTDHNYNGLNWLSNVFDPFVYRNGTSNAVKLPIDSHSLIGTIAPRGLLILENPHVTQMSAPAGHTAAVSGAEVYKALGVAENITYQQAVAQTSHCQYNNEYTDLIIANIKKFLKHESAETGKFIVGPKGSLTLSDWKDWEAPTF